MESYMEQGLKLLNMPLVGSDPVSGHHLLARLYGSLSFTLPTYAPWLYPLLNKDAQNISALGESRIKKTPI